MSKYVFILSALRSAIGGYGGALKDTSPIDLGTRVANEAIKKSGLNPEHIGHAIYGHVIHTEPRDMYSPCLLYTSPSPRDPNLLYDTELIIKELSSFSLIKSNVTEEFLNDAPGHVGLASISRLHFTKTIP